MLNNLPGNKYPGRGFVMGTGEDAQTYVLAYFIMGRSRGSRNRIFTEENGTLRTRAFDESGLPNPSLYVYRAVRDIPGGVIVTNGDQTDTIYDFIKDGKTFEDALRTREFEPDPPIWTPRISGIIKYGEGYKISILKRIGGRCVRYFFEYPFPSDDLSSAAGTGHVIHTYEGDGNPVPSFEGEPREIEIKGTIDEFTEKLWGDLNEDNRVSLYVRFVKDGVSDFRIINKNAE